MTRENVGVAAVQQGSVRVLVLAESLPYPTLKGGDLRTWQNVNALAAFVRVGVFGLCSNDSRRDVVPALPLACWAASTDPALTVPPPLGVRLAAREWLLDAAGHPSDLLYSDVAARELAAVLRSFRPDVVLIEGLWLHGYIDTVRLAGCRAVLDCQNVEAAVFRELARTDARQGLEGRVLREVLPVRTEALERRAVRRADQIWVCSEEDECRLREAYDPAASVVVVPNAVRLEDYTPATAREEQPPAAPLTVLFPGIFSYRPNALAAQFLVEEVLPRLVAAGAACRLLLVGPMPTPELLAAAARDARIVVTGPVRDVRPYFAAATVLAVPLFQGGGTRMKILEAFASGLPVVSTAKGAEGLHACDGTHLLIAETAGDFAEAVLSLWRDPARGRQLAARARALVAERFTWDSVGPRVRRAVAALGV